MMKRVVKGRPLKRCRDGESLQGPFYEAHFGDAGPKVKVGPAGAIPRYHDKRSYGQSEWHRGYNRLVSFIRGGLFCVQLNQQEGEGSHDQTESNLY